MTNHKRNFARYSSYDNDPFCSIPLHGDSRSLSAADNSRVGAYAITSSVASLISQLSAYSSDDIYDFPDQYKVILVINGIGAIWLLTSVYSTLRPRPKLASLYVPFLIFYCLWFLAEPIFLLVVFYALPQLETPNIKNGVYLTLSVLGHAVFFIVIRPRGLEERFPYCMPANKVQVETEIGDDEREKQTSCNKKQDAGTR
ncbi:transmembrane protein 145-like [Strongylocentrotus purpuratus]|uniref:GPR180/TMEM145 transmembrane domain-containing protein n=1 Tax=Strongylocentrotus purpuratus TaxID=7668 RepID=A0A7M7N2D3_STRPU|nr:transmembrane protein 145-like [Strongylocentrotus purpuratus]